MSFETLMTELRALNSSVEALAALGAELRLRCEGLGGDPRVRPLLQDVVNKINPQLCGPAPDLIISSLLSIVVLQIFGAYVIRFG
jgi:hypothetical protein